MKKRWNIIVALVAVALVAVASFIYVGVIPSSTLRSEPTSSLRLEESDSEGSRTTRDPSSTDDGRRDDTVSGQDDNDFDQNHIDSGRDDTALNEATCSSVGGTWNPCGSACRTDPDAICIELCVEYCECQSDAQCPSGYACGDFVEGVGVCL